MKELIEQYIRQNLDFKYYDLCKVFGLPIEKLFEVLEFSNYTLGDNKFRLHVDGIMSYFENIKGYWELKEINQYGYYYRITNSEGNWESIEYNENHDVIKRINSTGACMIVTYEKNGLYKEIKFNDLVGTYHRLLWKNEIYSFNNIVQ